MPPTSRGKGLSLLMQYCVANWIEIPSHGTTQYALTGSEETTPKNILPTLSNGKNLSSQNQNHGFACSISPTRAGMIKITKSVADSTDISVQHVCKKEKWLNIQRRIVPPLKRVIKRVISCPPQFEVDSFNGNLFTPSILQMCKNIMTGHITPGLMQVSLKRV